MQTTMLQMISEEIEIKRSKKVITDMQKVYVPLKAEQNDDKRCLCISKTLNSLQNKYMNLRTSSKISLLAYH